MQAPVVLVFLTCASLAAAPAGAPTYRAAPGSARRAQAASLEELDAEWDRALLAWAEEWYARWKADPQAAFGPSPAGDFWPRYEALVRKGDDRALPWLLQHLEQTDASARMRRERARRLFERLRAAGPQPWVPEALPLLVACRERLGDDESLRAALNALAGDRVEPAALRREARLALAALAGPADALVLSLEAFRRPDEPHLELDAAGAAALDVVALRVAGYVDEQGREHFRRYHVSPDGVHVQVPGAPPTPEQRLRPALEGLAEAGSVMACLWLIDAARPQGAKEVARVRDHLARVAAAELDRHQLTQLAWNLSELVAALGPEPVEAALETLLPQADDETRARMLLSFGEGLCELDGPQRERGLELMREVAEDHPETRAGAAAVGALFRREQLVVGRPCPDFEAEDVGGARFRLSDHRGQVTLLEFWGFW